jgi:tetraacyldisaccharide 4'-kinase
MLAKRLARSWEKRARPVRPVKLPEGAVVIGVSGTTLGGSGKTPVVSALASTLRDHGASVSVVASGYGASPPAAVRVLPHHGVLRAGDEALMLARELAGVPVFVGRDRERVLALAAQKSNIIVVDSLLQTAPQRLALSVLVADGRRPWGSGACPPLGDLRARRDRLLRAADVLLVNGRSSELEELAIPSRRWPFERTLEEARTPDGRSVPLDALAGRSFGLLTTLARPDRLEARLTAAGVRLGERRFGPDHGRLVPRARRPAGPDIEAWLTTAKCATKLEQAFENIPVWVLRERVDLPPELLELLAEKGWIPRRRAVLESAPCSAE